MKTAITINLGDEIAEAVDNLECVAKKRGYRLDEVCFTPMPVRVSTTDFSKPQNPPAWAYLNGDRIGIPSPLEFKDIDTMELGEQVGENSWIIWLTLIGGKPIQMTNFKIRDANELIGSYQNWRKAQTFRATGDHPTRPLLDGLRADLYQLTSKDKNSVVKYDHLLEALKELKPEMYDGLCTRWLVNTLAKIGYGADCGNIAQVPDHLSGLYLIRKPAYARATQELEGAFIKHFPRVLERSGLNTMALGYEAIVEVYKALDPITFADLDKSKAKETLAAMGRMGKLKDCYIHDDSVQGLIIKGGSLLKAIQNMEDETLVGKHAIQFIWPAPNGDTDGTSYAALLERLKEYRPAEFGTWDSARLKGVFKRISEVHIWNDVQVLEHGLGGVLLVPETVLATRSIIKETAEKGDS